MSSVILMLIILVRRLCANSRAEDGGVEPHPISENLVFKASRRTIPPASSSLFFLYLASREGLEPPLTVLETAMLPLHHRDILLVQPRGIEPLSTDLQTAAMTTSAKVALFIGVSDGDRTHAYRNHNPRPYHLATDTI